MGIHGNYFLSREEEYFISPEGWDFDIYSFSPKQFAFSKTNFQLGQHVDITRYNFYGKIRFRAMKRPKLQFDFIDSYSTESSRLQSINGVDSILMISLGGSYWEGVSDIGACGIEVNFDEDLTKRILAPNGDLEFQHRVQTLIGGQSLVLPLTDTLMPMKRLVERYVNKVDYVKRETQPSDLAVTLPRLAAQSQDFILDPADLDHFEPCDELLAEMARNILSAWSISFDRQFQIGLGQRRLIALEIERLLWEPPLSREADHDVSLDELADRFSVSRRTVQLAVQEHFGMGFVALRRIIRLHQMRHALIFRNEKTKITTLANEYFLGHMGRVSRDYMLMFGVKPSAERLHIDQLRQYRIERERGPSQHRIDRAFA